MSFRIRDARYSDLPEIARVMSLAFWDDNLFGDFIHPHRDQHPADFDLWWLRRARVNFWDWRWKWLVAVARDEAAGREVIVGVAQWERLGDGGRALECHALDPRNLLKPLSSVAMKLHAVLWPNRAADPAQEDVLDRAYPCFGTIWFGPRAESWYLDFLAVHPDFQGQGIGRRLVQWGLDAAEAEGVCASVISALGKDPFYVKCGFNEQFGWAGDGEGNPLANVEGANMHWRWPGGGEAPGVERRVY